MTIRGILESVTREWRIRRRLPADLGRAPIWVSPAGGLRYLMKPMDRIDPELLGLAKEVVRPGDVVWDIGANLGLFAIASANLAGPQGRVVACEPDEWLVGLLRRSVRAQGDQAAQVTILSVAIASELSMRNFCIARRARATNFLAGYGSTQTGGVAEERSVIAVSLDWLSERLPLPNVLKIDVEGAELEVLQGATKLLSTARPVVLCEVSESASADVSVLLGRYGYQLFDGSRIGRERVALERAPWSTLALPREMSPARVGVPLQSLANAVRQSG